MTTATTLKVMKKKNIGGEKTAWYQVGIVKIRENGNGSLYLNFLDGDFALFPPREGDKADAESPAAE